VAIADGKNGLTQSNAVSGATAVRLLRKSNVLHRAFQLSMMRGMYVCLVVASQQLLRALVVFWQSKARHDQASSSVHND
jgi:hypothetical protein